MDPPSGLACVSRGEGDKCDWSDASPQFIRPKGSQVHPSHLLARHENPARLRVKHDLWELDSRVELLLETVKRLAPATSAELSRPETVPATNYHLDDIATQLSRFTLNQAIPQLPLNRLESNPNSQISVKEVEEYAEEEERKAESSCTFNIGSGGKLPSSDPPNQSIPSSVTTSPIMDGLLGIGKGPATFEGIMAELPKFVQLKACLEQFEYHRAWMHRIIHRPTFWNQVYDQISHNFSYTDQRAQAHWLAILFSVCGLGLFNNVVQSKSALADYGLPIKVPAQRALALRWCRAATSCLEVGAYETAPSMDSITAMAILAQLPLYTSNGETLGLALDFIGKAIDLAIKLDLHIDPDSHPIYRNSTALAKQNRRRLMVALLCQHYKMGGLLCQDRGLRPLEHFAGLELPLDQFDEDFDPVDGQLKNPRVPGSTRTIMTGVRCRFQVSRVWQEIGIMLSNPAQPPLHENILKIDAKLKRLEAEWPESIRTQFNPATCTFTPPFTLQSVNSPGRQVLLIDRLGCFAVLAAAMVRLHRGFMMDIDGAPAGDIKLHREQVYYYGRAMLAIHRTKLFPLDNVPLQFFVLSSTISLAVYCLTSQSLDEVDKCEVIISELEKIKNVLKLCTAMSSILRRTYAVLKFTLNKWAVIQGRNNPVDHKTHKRARLDVDSNQPSDSNVVNPLPNLPKDENHGAMGSSITSSTLKGSNQHDELLDDATSMENLLRSLIQDHPWPDSFELSHDKQLQNLESVSTNVFNFTEVPHSFDFSHLFQLDSSHFVTPSPITSNAPNGGPSPSTSTGNAHSSGSSTIKSDRSSSISYLSTPSSSSNLALSSVFNEQEPNSSPNSLSYSTAFPFGSNFDHEQSYQPTSTEPGYSTAHHPVIYNVNDLSGIAPTNDSSLDGSIKLVLHGLGGGSYGIVNGHFDLPIKNPGCS